MTEAQYKATKKYQATHYDYFKLRFDKGDLALIKSKAQESGKSMNQYILDKIFGK